MNVLINLYFFENTFHDKIYAYDLLATRNVERFHISHLGNMNNCISHPEDNYVSALCKILLQVSYHIPRSKFLEPIILRTW